MPKTDNPHALRLYESLLKHSSEEVAQRIANGTALSKSANAEKKFAWAERICGELEKEFDTDLVKAIRMDCACGPGAGKIHQLRKLFLKTENMDDFAEKMNGQNKGFTMEHRDHCLYLIYPECYCSCVKQVEKEISKAWCSCTLGYTKTMFEGILGQEVEVTLLESVKTGGKVCRIQVRYFSSE